MVFVSAPGSALNVRTAARSVSPATPSAKPATLMVAGTARSSSDSRAGRRRGGALRIGRGVRGVNRLRIQVRVVTGRLFRESEDHRATGNRAGGARSAGPGGRRRGVI